MKIGLLGCGNIGQILAKHDAGRRIVAVWDQVPEYATRVSEMTGARVCPDSDAFLADDFDILLEAASVEAVEEYCEPALEAGKDLIILSVGALADEGLRKRLCRRALDAGRKIRIPSGALFGLDNLKIARVSRLDRIVLRSTKTPASLNMETDEKQLLFRGPAHEGIRRFPRNVNVAVAMSLAAGRDVDMELWVDPTATHNRHEVIIEGEFGEANIAVNNVPCPDNPATSYLAALSVMALLDGLDEPLIIGT